MKMTNFEVVSHINGLNNMEEREQEEIKDNKEYKKMNIKVVYSIMKNKKSLIDAIKPYNEALNELAKSYGAKVTENGIDTSNVSDEKKEEFTTEVNDLLAIELEVDIRTVPVDYFGDFTISQLDFDILNFMIE